MYEEPQIDEHFESLRLDEQEAQRERTKEYEESLTREA